MSEANDLTQAPVTPTVVAPNPTAVVMDGSKESLDTMREKQDEAMQALAKGLPPPVETEKPKVPYDVFYVEEGRTVKVTVDESTGWKVPSR